MRATVILTLSLAAAACGERVELGEATAVSEHTDVGAAPVIAFAQTGTRAVAWVSAPGGGSDGRLYVALDDAHPIEMRDTLGPIEAHGEAPPKLAYDAGGALHAIYVVGREIPGRRFPASALRHVRSDDGGRSWSVPTTVTDDETFGSHNFHALHAADDGHVYAAWLDGRHGTSAAYVAHSRDGGRTWSSNVRVSTGEACPCCRTAIATAPDGAVYLAWRGVLDGGVRDVIVARSTDRGATWSEPRRVHADDWKFDGCPHAGPALRVDAEGVVHVGWWTGREGGAGAWYARSTDGARSFEDPIPLGVADFSRAAHVQLALGDGGLVAAAWDDGTVQTPAVRLRLSRDGGRSFGPPVTVSGDGRVATFPMLAVSGRTIAVAWAEKSEQDAEHEAAHAPDMRDPTAVKKLGRVGASHVMLRTGRVP